MMIINFGVFYENKQYNLKTKFNLMFNLSGFFFFGVEISNHWLPMISKETTEL